MFARTAFLLLVLSPVAHAARPFMTDDARVTTARSCQLESWMRIYPKSTEFWALPACNPTGNLELTAGGGHFRYDEIPSSSDYVLQAKTLIRTIETNGYGIGLAVGRMQHHGSAPGPNELGNTYAYIPVTLPFADDRALVHTNFGWLRDRETRRDNLTWGIGGEYAFTSRISMMAETFGDNRVRPYWQTGIRTFLVPGRVQIDGTIGNQWAGQKDGRWFSIGIRLTPDRLF